MGMAVDLSGFTQTAEGLDFMLLPMEGAASGDATVRRIQHRRLLVGVRRAKGVRPIRRPRARDGYGQARNPAGVERRPRRRTGYPRRGWRIDARRSFDP